MDSWLKSRLLGCLGYLEKVVRMLVLLFLFKSLTSCGEPPLKEKDLVSLFAEQDCQIDAKALKEFLTKDVTQEINCLESKLNQFADVVKRKDPNYIEQDELGRFVSKFFPELKADFDESSDLMFTANSLFTGDPTSAMSIKNLSKFFKVFRKTNELALEVNRDSNLAGKLSYWKNRNRIIEILLKLRRSIENILIQNGETPTGGRVHLTTFIDQLNPEPVDSKLVDAILVFKRLLVGGTKKVLTTREFYSLVQKLDDLALIALDGVFVHDRKFISKDEQYLFYLDLLNRLERNLFPWESGAEMFDQKELIRLVREYLMPNLNEFFEESTGNLKEILIGGNRDRYTFYDFLQLLNITKEAFEKLYFNEITFARLETKLLSVTEGIGDITFKPMPEYKIYPDQRVKVLWEEFVTVLEKYQCHRGNQNIRIYDQPTKKNRSGYNKISLLRWVFSKLLPHFGPVRDGEVRLTREEFKDAALELKGFLVELNLWDDNLERFVEDNLSSSDLFQTQSDGDDMLTLDELTEFIDVTFSSGELRDRMVPLLERDCGWLMDPEGGFELNCYRNHFFEYLFSELKLDKEFPLLKKYIEEVGPGLALKYLKNVEGYARILPSEDVPMTKRDLSRLFVSLQNMESLYVQYDKNGNGVFEYEESEPVYQRFKKRILEAGNLKESDEGLGRSAFFLLNKTESLPSDSDILFFHVFGNKKEVIITRKSLSAMMSGQ